MHTPARRWQLLVKPLTLDEFNGLPKVTPYFFEFNLKIRTKLQNPIEFRVQTEIKIGAHEPMRYKYKLYPADEVENPSLNHYAFCQLKEDRLVGSFIITPPIEGRYFLKVSAAITTFCVRHMTNGVLRHVIFAARKHHRLVVLSMNARITTPTTKKVVAMLQSGRGLC